MDLVLRYLNSISSYANWLIDLHLREYGLIAAGVFLIGLIFLIFVRSKIMYIFPVAFFLAAAVPVIMAAAGAANFEWDYMLLLAFVNLVPGYILFLITAMALSRQTI